MNKKFSPKNTPRRPNPFSILLIIALVGAAASLIFRPSFSGQGSGLQEDISVSEMIAMYQGGEFEEVSIKDQKLIALGKNGNTYHATKEVMATMKDLGLDDVSNPTKVTIVDTSSNKVWSNILMSLAPFVLIILFLVFLSRRSSSMGGDGGPFGFGKSRAKLYDKEKHNTKFTDVAGAEEAKEEVF